MNVLKPALIGIALTVAGCGGTPDLYSVTPPAVTETVRISFRAVEVRDVSLPTYAAADEIAVRDETGKLVTDTGTLWADSPERAVALELAGNLARLSGARVASEPWPFELSVRPKSEIENVVTCSATPRASRAVWNSSRAGASCPSRLTSPGFRPKW